MSSPTVGSLFSGVGGFDLGLERAGFSVLWQVEIVPFRQRILARHWPAAERRRDVRTDTDGLGSVDLITGGFPCQDISVAGSGEGLAGAESGLWTELVRVVREIRPPWILVENVPRLLSIHEGQDMALVLETFAELGYGLAWRVLDSQYFGVPQRRRRLYIVGCMGAPCPLEILFEPESVLGNSEEGGSPKSDIAGTLAGGSVRGWSDDLDRGGTFLPEKSHALVSKDSGFYGDGTAETYIAEQARTLRQREGGKHDFDQDTYIVNARQDPIHGAVSLDTNGHSHALVSGTLTRDSSSGKSFGSKPIPGNLVVCPPPDANGVREAPGLPRRLDPATPDGPRYAALGDAVTVPVAEWIGRRLLRAIMERRPHAHEPHTAQVEQL